jgi:hypothetical protein
MLVIAYHDVKLNHLPEEAKALPKARLNFSALHIAKRTPTSLHHGACSL